MAQNALPIGRPINFVLFDHCYLLWKLECALIFKVKVEEFLNDIASPYMAATFTYLSSGLYHMQDRTTLLHSNSVSPSARSVVYLASPHCYSVCTAIFLTRPQPPPIVHEATALHTLTKLPNLSKDLFPFSKASSLAG